MLNELRRYDNIGTTAFFWEVLNLFYSQPNTDWTTESINAHFRGRIISGKDIFNGGLRLLVFTGVLEIDITGIYHLSHAFSQCLYSQDHCRGKILEAILASLKNDDDMYLIFSPEFCSYDIINNVMQINKSAFGLKDANIRDILIDLGFLIPHPNFPAQSFAVNKPNRRLFDKHLTEGMKSRQLSPEQLHSIQAKQLENGLIGEKFVFNYECRRTGRDEDIEWIAVYDSSAGFDIMSFESNISTVYDRFIEVKSYSGSTPYFYWSRNEMRVSRLKSHQYFLYLVDIDEIDNLGYEPIIISNPSVDVLENDAWNKAVDKYHISKR